MFPHIRFSPRLISFLTYIPKNTHQKLKLAICTYLWPLYQVNPHNQTVPVQCVSSNPRSTTTLPFVVMVTILLWCLYQSHFLTSSTFTTTSTTPKCLHGGTHTIPATVLYKQTSQLQLDCPNWQMYNHVMQCDTESCQPCDRFTLLSAYREAPLDVLHCLGDSVKCINLFTVLD